MDDGEVTVERDKDEVLEEKNDSQTESILGQLQVLEDKKFIRAKTKLEIIKNSERVTINHDNVVKYVDQESKLPYFYTTYNSQQKITQSGVHYHFNCSQLE